MRTTQQLKKIVINNSSSIVNVSDELFDEFIGQTTLEWPESEQEQFIRLAHSYRQYRGFN